MKSEHMHGHEEVQEQEEMERGEVVEGAPADGPRGVAMAWLRTVGVLVVFAAALVLILLGFRLGFLMAEANPANGFVDFIYDASGPLVDPFDNIAGNRTLDNGGIFEPASVIAMAVYFLAAMLIVGLLWALAAASWLSRNAAVVRRRRIVRQH